MATQRKLGRPRAPRPLSPFERAAIRWLLTRGDATRFARVSKAIGVSSSRLHQALLIADERGDPSKALPADTIAALRAALTSETGVSLDHGPPEVPLIHVGHDEFHDYSEIIAALPFLAAPRSPVAPPTIRVGLDKLKLLGALPPGAARASFIRSTIPLSGVIEVKASDGRHYPVRVRRLPPSSTERERAYRTTLLLQLGRGDWRKGGERPETNPVIASIAFDPRYPRRSPAVSLTIHGSAFALGVEAAIAESFIAPLRLRHVQVRELHVAVDTDIDSRALVPLYRGDRPIKTEPYTQRHPERQGTSFGGRARQTTVYEKRGQWLASVDPKRRPEATDSERRESTRTFVPIPTHAARWPTITRIELRRVLDPADGRTPAAAVRSVTSWASRWRVADLRRIETIDVRTVLLAEAMRHGFTIQRPSRAMVKKARKVIEIERHDATRTVLRGLVEWRRVFGDDHPRVAKLSKRTKAAYVAAVRVGELRKDEREDAGHHFSVRVLADLMNGERTRRTGPAIAAACALHDAVARRLDELAHPATVDLAAEVRRAHRALWTKIRDLVARAAKS